MANKERGEVALQFGEDEYTIKFDLNALAELEDHFEGDLNRLAELFEGGKGHANLIRKVLHLALKNKHPDLSEEDIGRLVGEAPGATFGEQLQYVMAKFGEAFGTTQLDQAPAKKKGRERTGKRFSA